MNKQTCIAEGINIDNLIGRTIYFELIARKICVDLPKHKAEKPRMIYNLIPGRVLGKNDKGTKIMLQSPDSTFNNMNIRDVVMPEDLDKWMQKNPKNWFLKG